MSRKPSLLRTVIVMVALVLLGMAIRAFVLIHDLRPIGVDEFHVHYIEHVYYPTWTRLDGLLAGVALALLRTFRPPWWHVLKGYGHVSLLTGFALLGLSMWLFNHRMDALTGPAAWSTVVGFPLLAIAFALLVASAVSTNGWLNRARVPGVSALATLAFSLYLIHKAVAHLTGLYMPSLTEQRNFGSLLVYAATCRSPSST